ncbi:MAG: polysaccharide biosynthesis protein [Pirellulaceae bacterium]|nr:MAG: polysaccharide biosynthesis protein [Pirellulaceae bacterium]
MKLHSEVSEDAFLSGKRVLVTGGTGSMGKVLVRRILSGELGEPAKVIVFSRDEAKHAEMRQAYLQQAAATDELIYSNFLRLLEFRLGDIRSYADVAAAVRDADVVIHAAALKQVPNCEYFPEQAVATNCRGAENLVRAIREHQYPVEVVVGISTDKACQPINVMGMTKAIQERIFTAANILIPQTRFICTRYGNVLASRGSVIPLFHEQIRQGGPVTVTVPEMTRFLMSLDEAVDCVFAALRWARPGEIFVPCAPAATVMNVAKALVGDRPIRIVVTGIRPGEKMHEVMISEEECHHAYRRGNYYAIESMLPELRLPHRHGKPLGHPLSSADCVIDLEETRALLDRHGLLDVDKACSYDFERFRLTPIVTPKAA